MLGLFILSFVMSLAAAYFILRGQGFHSHVTRDIPLPGSHKIHDTDVPRIGGVAVFVGWVTGLAAASYAGYLYWSAALAWVACLLPVFAAGLAEDLTKRVRPRTRLLWSLVSAGLAYGWLGVAAHRIDVPGGEALLAIPVVSFVFTLLAVGGLAHAVNIVDGLHGLALSVCFLALVALGYVAFQVNDSEMVLMSGLGAAAVLGLRAWNYPSGQIFCGDGGAYFLGCYVALLSGLLVGRNPQVSAWFPVLALLYPIWETLFSAYRRKIVLRVPASAPDNLHLHSLMFATLVGDAGPERPGSRGRCNSDASHSMVLLALMTVVPASLWWNDSRYLVASALGFVVVYLVLYRRLETRATAVGVDVQHMPIDPRPGRTFN